MIRVRVPRAVHVGVALGPRELVAVRLGSRQNPGSEAPWCCPIEPPGGEDGWPDLARAFAQLRESLPLDRVRLHVALLPPLIQVKRIELPRLADDTLRQVLIRDAARYFPGVGGAQLIAVSRLSNGRRSPQPYLVTAVRSALIEALFQAVSQVGWMVETVASAHAAWAAGVVGRRRALARESAQIVVAAGDRMEVLQLQRGRLGLVRRFAEGETTRMLEAVADPESGSPWVVLAPESRRIELFGELKAGGRSLLEEEQRQAPDSPDVLAARSAGLAPSTQLLPERVRQEKRRRETRLSARLLAGAAALLVCSAGLEYWGAYRELAELRFRRDGIQATVAKAMDVRQEMSELDDRLRSLAQAETSRSQWARTLVSVAEYLPRDAHLVGFRGDADSLRLEGEAKQAAVVFESFQRAPGVVAVRADAPISQETRDSVPIERFTLAARLAAP